MDVRTHLVVEGHSSCYFRTSVMPPWRKAIIQITERCNLNCAHCFVSATRKGRDMMASEVVGVLVPQLKAARVVRVTLTGGEPFVHPDMLPIVRALVESDIDVGLCTNGTLLVPRVVEALAQLRRVHVNVSVDGFTRDSHGAFRGSRSSFDLTRRGMARLAEHGILQGILSTPHSRVGAGEYRELYAYASALGAQYLLLNPMAPMGRGFAANRRVGVSSERLTEIRDELLEVANEGTELVFVRFPSSVSASTECEAGRIFYVYATGRAVVCPYLDFASRNPTSMHDGQEFALTDVLAGGSLAAALDSFEAGKMLRVLQGAGCATCPSGHSCGNGCPAAIVAAGHKLGQVGEEAGAGDSVADEGHSNRVRRRAV